MPNTEPHVLHQNPEPSAPKNRLSVNPDVLFVYGSLRFPEVLHALLGRVPPGVLTQTLGWRAAALSNRVYPGLLPAVATADGYLLTDLTPHEWEVLDAFEDPDYELFRLDLAGGRHGWAYVCGPEAEILPEPWSADEFARRHLAEYVERCTAWRQRYRDRRTG